MCVSKGAPAKPVYGPCNEQHGTGDLAAAMTFMISLLPVMTILEATLEKMKEGKVCV